MAAITANISRLGHRLLICRRNLFDRAKWRSYIGSVRFFKHLILTVLLLLITVPWFFVAGLYIKYSSAAQEIAQMEQMMDASFMGGAGQNPNDSVLLNVVAAPSEVPSYQLLYPDFYAPQELNIVDYSDKTIYLTFDDGPSPRTPEVLKILEEKGVKATFFVVGQNDEQSYQWMRDIVAEGHTIGMHSYTHQYKKIYSSVESYLEDMYKMFTQIKEVTGVTPTVFRFPGGSINAYNTGINQEIIAEMLRRGFVPYDWNVSSEDAATTPPSADRIVSSVLTQAGRVNRGVVLMHDSDYKYTTVAALPQMIDKLKEQGFVFSAIQPETQPVLFGYQN